MEQQGREIRIDDLNPWVLLNELQIKDTQNITLTLLKLSTQSPFGHCSVNIIACQLLTQHLHHIKY